MAALRFYDFTGDAGTSWSSVVLPSLAGAAAVDVDRDGITDIVYRDATTWWWMRSAMETPRRLRSNVDPMRDLPAAMLWGNVDGLGGLDTLRWQGGSSKAFVSWRGIGSADAGVEHLRTMR